MKNSYINRSIAWFKITSSYQYNIDKSPNTKTTETEEFSDAFLPETQIKTIDSEAAQCYASEQ